MTAAGEDHYVQVVDTLDLESLAPLPSSRATMPTLGLQPRSGPPELGALRPGSPTPRAIPHDLVRMDQVLHPWHTPVPCSHKEGTGVRNLDRAHDLDSLHC